MTVKEQPEIERVVFRRGKAVFTEDPYGRDLRFVQDHFAIAVYKGRPEKYCRIFWFRKKDCKGMGHSIGPYMDKKEARHFLVWELSDVVAWARGSIK